MDTTSLRQFLSSVNHNQAEIKRRRLTLYFISYVGGFIMAALAIENFNYGDYFLTMLISVCALAVFINVALSHIFTQSNIFYYTAGVIVALVVFVVAYTGGYLNTGLYFFFPLIFIQIVIVGYKASLGYAGVTVGVVAFILYNQNHIPSNYAPEHVTRFLISASCFLCVAFIGEFFWHQSHREMMTDNLEKIRQANTDPLTKLPNRRFLESVYFERTMIAPSEYFPLSLVVADIDYFKVVNDTFGHDAGDQVLIHTAKLMKQSIRSTDVIVRTGGEEFLILYPKTTLSQAMKLAEKIRQEVEKDQLDIEGVEHSLTSSFGVATALTEANINATLKLADDNLYTAKQLGRNRVV